MFKGISQAMMSIAGLGTIVFCFACGPSQREYDVQVHRVEELLVSLEATGSFYVGAQERIRELESENVVLAGRFQALAADMSILRARSRQLSTDFDTSLEVIRRLGEEIIRLRRILEEEDGLGDSL